LTFPLRFGYLESFQSVTTWAGKADEEALRNMPSKVRSVRETQKNQVESAIERRRNLLIDRGVDKARVRKDPYLRHLQAALRQTRKRLGALEALEKQKEALALRKEKLAEEPAEKPPEPPPAEKKKKTEKTKKKEQP